MATSVSDLAGIVADDFHEIEPIYVHQAIRLMETDNTIPFIARYRRKQTGGLDATKLRELKIAYDTLRTVKNKVQKIVEKDGATIPRPIQESLFHAKTMEEVNDLYAPYKKGGKGTLAERARSHGLEGPAMQILASSKSFVNFSQFVKKSTDGLKTVGEVHTGIQHIIADVISKDDKVSDMVNKTLMGKVFIETKTTDEKRKADKENKFSHYYHFCINTKNIKSHQVLAINRGEEQKILTTKIFMSDTIRQRIVNSLMRTWVPRSTTGPNKSILSASVDDAFKRLIEKKFLKRIRVRLTAVAEREAAEVFSSNLQKLLLAPPVRGKNVLGVDPGFRHGCKIAALDKHGQLLGASVVFPFGSLTEAEQSVATMVKKNRCEVIAIGNGTARHETENFIANMLKKGLFFPVGVSYCIVNEAGASVWSVSKEADLEFPKLSPNLKSAVSIGRRLQDPLLELVKIEPKHIGVGMYQHDISEILLKGALEGVLEDCVNFVGVDLNACSAAMLRRIAGLGSKKADAIIEWRNKNGPFVNREQLLLVKGLGRKCFEQCAGFVRVMSVVSESKPTATRKDLFRERIGSKRKLEDDSEAFEKKRRIEGHNYAPEPLDQTMIHPESYAVAYQVLQEIGSDTSLIGTKEITSLLEEISDSRFIDLVRSLNTDEETLGLIIKALKQPLNHDLRSELEQPLFKREVKAISDLIVGQLVTGVVRNVTSFGVFVDIGVGRDALIHRRDLAGCTDLGPGDKCECAVLTIDELRQRVGLRLKSRTINAPLLR